MSIMPKAALLSLLLISGHALANEQQCRANFKQTGSFLMGRTFSSWEEFPAETPQALFKRIYAGVAKSGLKIIHVDKEMGILSGEQATTGGDGSSATLDFMIVVEPVGKGAKVTSTLKSPPEKALSQEAVIKALCSE